MIRETRELGKRVYFFHVRLERALVPLSPGGQVRFLNNLYILKIGNRHLAIGN